MSTEDLDKLISLYCHVFDKTIERSTNIKSVESVTMANSAARMALQDVMAVTDLGDANGRTLEELNGLRCVPATDLVEDDVLVRKGNLSGPRYVVKSARDFVCEIQVRHNPSFLVNRDALYKEYFKVRV